MRTILRIEHPSTGKGIFTSYINGVGVDYLSNSANFYNKHLNFPTPYEDAKIKNKFKTGKHFCAFKSIDQFQEWVSPQEIKEFIKMGFEILLIDVSDHIEGMFQIIYYKEDIVQVKDITNLFK